MTTYRHVLKDEGRCDEMSSFVCGCTTPTPDPASPCGHEDCEHDGNATWTHPPAGPYLHGAHPHVPTRCATCGHAVEPAP